MMGWGKDWQRTTRQLITDGKDKDELRTYLARDGQVNPRKATNVGGTGLDHRRTPASIN